MSSSELSNALNPLVVAQRSRRRLHAQATAPTAQGPPVTTPAIVSQPTRSELEHAIAPPSPPPPPVQAPTIPLIAIPNEQQQAAPRSAAPVMQELYRVVATARGAAVAERDRRLAWERGQEARTEQLQAEVQRQLMDIRQEISMLRAYMSMQTTAPPPGVQQQGYIEVIPSTAWIEPVSPIVQPSARAPIPLGSLGIPSPGSQQPLFVEGSSSRPLTSHTSDNAVVSQCGSPTRSLYSPYGTSSNLIPPDTPGSLCPPTPQSLASPTPAPLTPEPESNSRKRQRLVVEDDSDYDSDSDEESDTPTTDRPLRRKNGHDNRCITIHHAIRIHIRKMMKLKHGEALPDSAFEGATIAATDPVRFVWSRTTKQSTTNATMKKRIISNLKENRHKYKYVPDKEFSKKTLDAAFEQVFVTLRQKFKAQTDDRAATRLKQREGNKAIKARRHIRKKTKLTNRSEARKKLDAFSQPLYDSALHQECMSSEESDGEIADADGSRAQVFRTRGPAWRSARLVRFYGVLDEQDRLDKAMLPKRGLGRRVRRVGPPKDGIFLPPNGVPRWMVSRRWLREMQATRPDVVDAVERLIVDPTEPEHAVAQVMLGPELSDEEEEAPATNVYAHVSDTSYSLYNALQPV